MRKTFELRPEGKNPDRVLDAVKHEIRKYIRRERRRELPDGVDYWDFDCSFGTSRETAAPVHVAELTGLIDAVARTGGPQFHVEVLARHGHRKPKTAAKATPAPDPAA